MNPNEFRLTRVYQAPLSLVWDCWTDPAHVAHWWGPRGFTLTTHSKELRAGGRWVYTMHGPDGVDYPNSTLYLEVVDRQKLVYDHGSDGQSPPLFRVTVLFTEVEEGTRMDMTMACPSPQAAADIQVFIRKAGGHATWDRLAEYLDKSSGGAEKFVINRSFAAPRELLYAMWTRPEHLSQWVPPSGCEMEYLHADIRAGGSSLYLMTTPGGGKMYGRAHYLSVDRPHRIIYTQQFCDEHGGVVRHPMAPSWPETMLTTVTLAEEGPAQTRVTLVWEPYGEVSREEIETFVKGRAGMTQGWTGSFDKLEHQLGLPSEVLP